MRDVVDRSCAGCDAGVPPIRPLPDLGAAHRQRLLSAIQPAADAPTGRAIARVLWAFTLLCLLVMLLAALVAGAAQLRDDVRETRRAVEQCR
jgi:hypothetical protein